MKPFSKILGSLLLPLAAAVLLQAGCREVKTASENGDPAAAVEAGPAYRAVFESWTREGRIYSNVLDVRLISSATYLAPQFRQAYTEEYARLYRMTEKEKAKLIQDHEHAAALYEDFIFAAYVPEKEWDDFHKKSSIWKIYATVDGAEQVKPFEVRRLDKFDAKIGYFYPYVTTWNSLYRLRFPKFFSGTGAKGPQDAPKAVTLVIASVLGSVEMVWSLN